MKSKKFKKLNLNKITVTNLARVEQKNIHGGGMTDECPSDEHSDCISLCGSVEPCSIWPNC